MFLWQFSVKVKNHLNLKCIFIFHVVKLHISIIILLAQVP